MINRYRHWIKAVKFTTIQKFVILGTNVLSFILLTRIVEPEVFGEWALFMAIAGLIETGRISMLRNGFIRFANSVDLGNFGVVQSSAFALSLMLTTIISGILYLVSFWIDPLLESRMIGKLLRYYPIVLFIGVLFSHFEMILTSRMLFDRVMRVQVTRYITFFLCVVVLILVDVSIDVMVLLLMYGISVSAGALVGYFHCREMLRFEVQGRKAEIGRLWMFGRFVLGNNLSSLAFRSTDSFLVSGNFGTFYAAGYSACLRISNLIDLPSAVFAEVVFPRASRISSEDVNEVRRFYEAAVGATLVFSIPAIICTILFADTILFLLAGPDYVWADQVLRITAFFGLSLPFLKQYGTIMDATGRPFKGFILMLFAFIVNIPLNVFFIWAFGVIGAAIGTALTYFMIVFFSLRQLHKQYKISILSILNITKRHYADFWRIAKTYFLNKKED